MDTSKKGADIIRNIMGNRNNLLILALLGVLVLVLAIPTEKKKRQNRKWILRRMKRQVENS